MAASIALINPSKHVFKSIRSRIGGIWTQTAGLATTTPSPTTRRPPLAFKYLGTVPYGAALDLQNALVEKRLEAIENPGPRSAESADLVLFLQHPHVYTGGRRIRGEDDTEGNRLRALGAEYFETERGGQVTYHGPGQLVGYPILNLKEHEASSGSRSFFAGKLSSNSDVSPFSMQTPPTLLIS